MHINHLTATEEQIMLLIWQLDSFYLKDLLEVFPEPKPHRNTISTYLKILVEKNFLTIQKEGKIFQYRTSISIDDYRLFLLKDFISKYCEGSNEEIIDILLKNHLVSQEILAKYPNKETSLPQQPPQFIIAEDILRGKKSKKKKSKKKKKKHSDE